MSRLNTRRSRGLRTIGIAALAAMVVVLAGCSSPEAGPAEGEIDYDNPEVARAQELLDIASESLLYGPTEGAVSIEDLRPLTLDDIKPHPWSGDSEGKLIYIVSGSATNAAHKHQVELATAYLEALGFEVQAAAGDFSAAGDQRAMDQALAANPDAIFNIAVMPINTGPQLAEAKARGIPVVYTVGTSTHVPGDISAYVAQSTNIVNALLAAQIIVESNATANIMWVTAPLFPEIESFAGIEFIKDNCSNCEVEEFGATDQLYTPVAMGTLTTSLLRANPDVDYLSLPAACVPVAAAYDAAQLLGDVKVEAQGCPADAIALMNSGILSGATGVAEPFSVLQGIDQILRILDGADPLPEGETGPPAFFINPENTPDDSLNATYGPIDRWVIEKFDFVKPYSEAWGVDLSFAIEDED